MYFRLRQNIPFCITAFYKLLRFNQIIFLFLYLASLFFSISAFAFSNFHLFVFSIVMYENTPKAKRSREVIEPFIDEELFTLQYTQNSSLAYRFRIGKYEYTTKDYLAEGFSSKVYRAHLINNKKQRFAIKVIDLSKFDITERELLDTQIQIITSLNHPNIIKCIDVYQTTKNYFLVTQYCPHGDLAQLVQLQKYIAEDMAVEIMKQILNGYKYLMSKNILHRDLKPSNVMRFGNVWKIGDFGFAKYCKGEYLLEKLYVGTPFYMPPQSLEVHKYSLKSDIFALGIIFYEILTGETPWPANTEKELIESMKEKQLTIPQLLKSQQVKYFLKHTIVIDYYQRMGKQEFKKFSFDSIDMEELSKIKSKGVSSHLKRELSKSGKKSYIFGTPSKINKNSFFCNSMEKESASSEITKTYGHQNVSPYQEYEHICDSNNKKIKQNYQIMSNQLELAKIISSIISGLKIFGLKLQDESFFSIIMMRLAIKMLKMISNKRQNYYRFHKWDVFKQSEKYSTCCIMIYSYISKLEMEYQGAIKNQRKLVAQLVNKEIPQLCQNNISFKAYGQLFQKLRTFIQNKILGGLDDEVNWEKKCYIIRQILELMTIIKNRSTRQQQIRGFGLKSKPDSTHAKKGLWTEEGYRNISKQLYLLCSQKIRIQ